MIETGEMKPILIKRITAVEARKRKEEMYEPNLIEYLNEIYEYITYVTEKVDSSRITFSKDSQFDFFKFHRIYYDGLNSHKPCYIPKYLIEDIIADLKTNGYVIEVKPAKKYFNETIEVTW